MSIVGFGMKNWKTAGDSHLVRNELSTALVVPMSFAPRIGALASFVVEGASCKDTIATRLLPTPHKFVCHGILEIKSHETRPDGRNLHCLVSSHSKVVETLVVRIHTRLPSILRKVNTDSLNLWDDCFERTHESENGVTPHDHFVTLLPNRFDGIDLEGVGVVDVRWGANLGFIGKDKHVDVWAVAFDSIGKGNCVLRKTTARKRNDSIPSPPETVRTPSESRDHDRISLRNCK